MWMRVGLGLVLAWSAGVNAGVLYDESVSGDLPDDRLAPATASFAPGLNDLIGSTVNFDRDYITATVPHGHQLTGIELIAFSSTTTANRGFAGFEKGPTISTEPTSGSSIGLFGWIVFGAFDTGFDWLPEGLTPGEGLDEVPAAVPTVEEAALGSTPVAIWVQETSMQRVDYSLRFTVTPIPEPTSLAVLGVACVGLLRRRA